MTTLDLASNLEPGDAGRGGLVWRAASLQSVSVAAEEAFLAARWTLRGGSRHAASRPSTVHPVRVCLDSTTPAKRIHPPPYTEHQNSMGSYTPCRCTSFCRRLTCQSDLTGMMSPVKVQDHGSGVFYFQVCTDVATSVQ